MGAGSARHWAVDCALFRRVMRHCSGYVAGRALRHFLFGNLSGAPPLLPLFSCSHSLARIEAQVSQYALLRPSFGSPTSVRSVIFIILLFTRVLGDNSREAKKKKKKRRKDLFSPDY
jgi:hypothetical protein